MPQHRWLGLGLLVILFASTSWIAAQGPRKEEEEDPKDKARPVVPVPVTEPEKKDVSPADAGDSDVGSFKDEAAKATHPAAKELFRGLINSYDRLAPNFKGATPYRVVPLPDRELPEGEFTVQKLDVTLRNTEEKKFATGTGFTYTPFEIVVIEEVDKFVEKKLSMSRDDQLDYAARAIASGLRWHLLAVNNNKRVGKGWEPVAAQLRLRHVALMRERFARLRDAKEFKEADELGLKMLAKYPENNAVLRDVYGLHLLRTRAGLKNPTDAELVKLRESLLLYEKLPGEKDEALIADARTRLKSRATTLVSEARDLDKQKMTAAALAKLRTAELLDPDLPAIATARTSLRGKVLYVGVGSLPVKMSPATAASDSERWAVELMFEGLLQVVPDPDLVRYRPALAESLPGVMPLGRSFTLPKNARWSRDNGAVVDARDVRGTLDLLRRPGFRDRWAVDGLDVFEQIDRVVDPFKLRLAYKQGVLEPLGRATFKVLPAQYLQDLGKTADDSEFARAPFGTGPFRYEGRETEGADRECAVFRANPHYGQRSGKFGLPWVREIRFFVPNQSSLTADVAGGQLHLYPDAPTDLAPRFRNEGGIKEIVRVESARTNRRIHLLAINHRQPALQNDKLRQGLAAAINREAILKDHFRSGDTKAHLALTGPFPFRSWATPATAREAPLYKPGAGGLIAEALAGRGAIRLRLAYEVDDIKKGPPKNKLVSQMIKSQIEQATTDKSGKVLVEIELQEMPNDRFHEHLHLQFDYDLALTTFDYRDDLYSLAGLLDPEAAAREGRNYLGYLAPGTNPAEADRRLRRLIEETRVYRDFTKQVKEKTWDIHSLFNQRVPFIPLWQLDRYMVVHRDLEIYFDNPDAQIPPDRLDPATVFTGVESWRLK